MNKNYLNRVVYRLVDETILDFIILKIYLPFSGLSQVAENGIFLSAGHFSNHSHLFDGFYNHCRNIYGLTDEEIEYSWDKYRHIIIDKIFQSTPLNESTGDKKYLDKVVDQLVNETRIESNGVYTPFFISPISLSLYIPISPLPLPSPFFPPFSSSSSSFFLPFYKHCRDVYGLNEEEVDYVWKQYKSIIEDKIKNKNP